MPELPELEVVRDALQRRVVGRAIERVQVVGSALTLRDLTGEGFARTLTGARIDDVRRRGKFLVFTLNAGALHLIINLVRSEFVAGIGNAYADEILWEARIHPYRKRTSLDAAEVERLFHAMQESLHDAIATVRAEMGEAIHREPRDFLKVHLRTGEPCPRSGSPISQVSANQRVTTFCRICQPGGLIRGLGQN